MRLINKTKNCELASEVRVANSFLARAKGLLGEKSLAPGSALWIQGSRWIPCNSVHTWFMRFAIDVVFVDSNLNVTSLHRNLSPWRMTAPSFGATSVFELQAGTLNQSPIDIGDQLYVGN